MYKTGITLENFECLQDLLQINQRIRCHFEDLDLDKRSTSYIRLYYYYYRDRPEPLFTN